MTDIDFNQIRAEVEAAIQAIQRAKDALKGDYSRTAVCAGLDLGHTIRDLQSGLFRLDETERILRGN